ncbi:cation efflux family-domain-containing protein [Thermothelomyces heterothallicus CBS 202.75]|uniref:cation efflux family-domain-containing protein n=1 Tax=Thermothelomyces heterothallicus CBS 202.75 TaxID=1149848 RepID=UPI0037445238
MGTGATQQTRGHAGHGHGHHHHHGLHHHHHHHHHHHDNVYLTSTNKSDAGVRITRIGLYSNLGMAVAKGAGGYAFNSQSMIADAWHSLTDLASDVLTLATVSWSLRPPTDKFPQGFGKVESLGSLGVSSMLLFGGLFMCISSCETLYAHFFLDPESARALLEHGHGHSHAHHHHHGHDHAGGAPSLHAAWLAAGTVAIKEWLYHATMKVARERKSSVLASNAVHHRVDSLTGIVALLAILGANLLRDATWLDPVGGLFISLLVIRAGFSNTLAALYELADRSIDEEVRASVAKQVGKGLASLNDNNDHDHDHDHDADQHRRQRSSSSSSSSSSVRGDDVELREVTGVKSGQNYLVDVELAVPGHWTVEDVRAVEEAVRARVGARVRGVRRLRVRFVPRSDPAAPGLFAEFIPGNVSPRSSPEPEVEEEEEDDEQGEEEGSAHGKGRKDL